MAKSNKPLIWGPFAAGGTVAAFAIPVTAALLLLAASGHVPGALSYETMRGIAAHWLGKLAIFGVISLTLWTSAHRVRITFYDLGVRADTFVATIVYLAAAAGTVLSVVFLLRL